MIQLLYIITEENMCSKDFSFSCMSENQVDILFQGNGFLWRSLLGTNCTKDHKKMLWLDWVEANLYFIQENNQTRLPVVVPQPCFWLFWWFWLHHLFLRFPFRRKKWGYIHLKEYWDCLPFENIEVVFQ
jgi:hypothetical protein